jgi:hypothetical protein
MLRRYMFKLYPNAGQADALMAQAQMCASLWNALLEMRETFYRRAKQRGDKKTSMTAFDQGKDITELRAAMPEWAAIPRGTLERVAGDLDKSFKAFFRRAKSGAGAQSGYPRFKSVCHANAIPLREPVKSSWSFSPSAHSGPARKSEPYGGEESSRARGEEGSRRPSATRGQASSRARGEEGSLSYVPMSRRPSSRARGWRLKMRGVPGTIKARGRFPTDPQSFKTADVMFRDGAWWLSVCVTFETGRIQAGDDKLTIKLNLIDEFASVEGANGRCAPGLINPFSAVRKGEFTRMDMGFSKGPCGKPVNAGEAQACKSSQAAPAACGKPVNAGEAQERTDARRIRAACGKPVNAGDAIQSNADRRYKKFSLRWKRERAKAARLSGKQARQRRDALHRWTTQIVRAAADLTVHAPAIAENIKSGRGNAVAHGAQVATIAALNRHVTNQAPAAAVAMLEYKAAEAGIRCDVIRVANHGIGVGRDLRAAAIAGRKSSRKLNAQKGK